MTLLEPAKAESGKTERLDLRMTPARRELLSRAARTTDQTITDFVIENAAAAAMDVLLDQKLFVVDPVTFLHFKSLIDAPAKENAGLRQLMATTTPWE